MVLIRQEYRKGWRIYQNLSVISPIADAGNRLLSLIPESISASVPAQTVAIEDEPFDSSISETTLLRKDFPLQEASCFSEPLCARLP